MQVQHASRPHKTTVSVIKTVGTLKDVSTRTHALMHTRAYLQQAHACWKCEILMCFITYKPIRVEKEAGRRHYTTHRQVAATASPLGISSRKQPHNFKYYLQIIRFSRKNAWKGLSRAPYTGVTGGRIKKAKH